MNIDLKNIEFFCKKWKVQQLAIFGSYLKKDFNKIGDVDILISFIPGCSWGFEIAEIREELSQIFCKPVDIVSKRSIEMSRNIYKKNEILNNCKIIYDKVA